MSDHDETNKSFDKMNNTDKECMSAINSDHFTGDNDHGDSLPPGMEIEDILLRNQQLYDRVFKAEMEVGDLLHKNSILIKELESIKQKKKNKRPMTRRVIAHGKPFYGNDTLPGPYIPFIVEYRPKHWLFGYKEVRFEFLRGLCPYGVMRDFKNKFPKAKIIGLHSFIWDKTFPNIVNIYNDRYNYRSIRNRK